MKRKNPAPAAPLEAACRRAYLDIETDWAMNITVVGVHRPGLGTRQWVRPRLSVEELRDFLLGADVLLTYNGACFDLPRIRAELKLDLCAAFPHRDLMRDCWSRDFYGGLKAVEKRLGIARDTDGVDGWAAVRLWERYKTRGDRDALELLLRYNREDVENLEALALRLGVVAGGTSRVIGALA
ncbi:MAG: ribonuclease H-like domain-containing protein [Elusimicrobiota bacterium]